MKITRIVVSFFLGAIFCAGVAARGQDAAVKAAAAPEPALVMTLLVPHGQYISSNRIPNVSLEDHNGAKMLHVQVVIHNLTDKALYLEDSPDEYGPYVEAKSGDGKSWVPFYNTAPHAKGGYKELKTVPPKGRVMFDVYFNNYAPGAPAKKFTGAVTLRAVLDSPAAKSAVWQGNAVSAPVECMIE